MHGGRPTLLRSLTNNLSASKYIDLEVNIRKSGKHTKYDTSNKADGHICSNVNNACLDSGRHIFAMIVHFYWKHI